MARNVQQKLGRPTGVPNKVTKAVKDMILGALEDVGGQDYLAEQAHENPSAFMSLVGKIIPNEVNAKVENSGTVIIEIIDE
jgi:hypothetical protein